MSVIQTYVLKCDGCGKVTKLLHDTVMSGMTLRFLIKQVSCKCHASVMSSVIEVSYVEIEPDRREVS